MIVSHHRNWLRHEKCVIRLNIMISLLALRRIRQCWKVLCTVHVQSLHLKMSFYYLLLELLHALHFITFIISWSRWFVCKILCKDFVSNPFYTEFIFQKILILVRSFFMHRTLYSFLQVSRIYFFLTLYSMKCIN